MVTNGVKMSLPLRTVLAVFALAAGGFIGQTVVRACCVAYASARLAQAADEGQAQEASYWLGRGANINAQDRFGDTPLMAAARNARPEVVRILLDRGANVHIQDHYGLSAAQWANFHLHDSRAILFADGMDIRQVPRPAALQTIALLQGSRQ